MIPGQPGDHSFNLLFSQIAEFAEIAVPGIPAPIRGDVHRRISPVHSFFPGTGKRRHQIAAVIFLRRRPGKLQRLLPAGIHLRLQGGKLRFLGQVVPGKFDFPFEFFLRFVLQFQGKAHLISRLVSAFVCIKIRNQPVLSGKLYSGGRKLRLFGRTSGEAQQKRA